MLGFARMSEMQQSDLPIPTSDASHPPRTRSSSKPPPPISSGTNSDFFDISQNLESYLLRLTPSRAGSSERSTCSMNARHCRWYGLSTVPAASPRGAAASMGKTCCTSRSTLSHVHASRDDA